MPESSFKYSISSLIDSVGFIDYEEPVSIFFNNIMLGKPDSINVLVFTIEGEPLIKMITYDGKNIKYVLDASKTSIENIITYIGNRFTKERNESRIEYNLYQDNRFLTTMLSYKNKKE
ncbi:DUF4362 domain-containing protein [Clostridium chromiireducens]|uniref:DUF4362 domain-containing protein n=1 Tax=Clostridium chromiireducens TaxID=225345 RepID=A0A964W5I2_9CLOT|nr:DUF4362 domain-containing protein [Clostridium chromiireducens]MVX67298.1 DUF4362 domain-containing protein [Clostridium chromiireducens]